MSRGAQGVPHKVDPEGLSGKAFALILAKLGRRDHTEQELREALGKKEFPEDIIEPALERAIREGLVDDALLARHVAELSARAGKRGPRRVIAALRQKGISAETAEDATKEAFSADQETLNRLVRLAERLLEKGREEPLPRKRVRVLRSLVGRGFELASARKALRLAENDLMTENRHDDDDANACE